MPKIKRINMVFLYARDMARMRRFYEETLGFNDPVIVTDLWVEYELPGAHLALHQGDPRVIEGHNPAKNTVRFSLEVDDLRAFSQSIKEKGVEFTFEPRGDFNSLLAEIQDVEGNPIRLIQYL